MIAAVYGRPGTSTQAISQRTPSRLPGLLMARTPSGRPRLKGLNGALVARLAMGVDVLARCAAGEDERVGSA